eukprot:CAMPEP_0198325934 /NCGR_PEP_ID=MMETSP1450-20131203/13568_1 /TAXON_ID=753684 ORGANISM="Madagascaria erythrocladiodes, Strain CCMP3234" /NCGR_SAMPLE_ID=MMETSP1450 /ASSEMBLY_ACC=CAM_ASM_001115 /LENGTH=105 /DNA_ID=CAMNT_0044029865 /DNA_START=53 /DNA_END=370 /DNA_ORIENTATION=-
MYGFVSTSVTGFAGQKVAAAPACARTVQRTARRSQVVTRMSLETTLASLPFETIASESKSMAVTFPAYLAVFLGTLIPVAFLVILFIQSEARKAGEASAGGGGEE